MNECQRRTTGAVERFNADAIHSTEQNVEDRCLIMAKLLDALACIHTYNPPAAAAKMI